MPLVRTAAWRPLRHELDRLFQDALHNWTDRTGFWNAGAPAGTPPVNLWESAGAFHVEMELPGVAQEALQIHTVGNELRIQVARREQPEGGVTYHRRERVAGAFDRTLRLPTDVDAPNVTATLKHGVLQVTLPKAAAAQPRRIEVRTS